MDTKKIPKKLLDEAIKKARAYWNNDYTSKLHDEKMRSAKKVAKRIGVEWLAVENFIDSVLLSDGFAPDANNEKIYSALLALGWEVVDE